MPEAARKNGNGKGDTFIVLQGGGGGNNGSPNATGSGGGGSKLATEKYVDDAVRGLGDRIEGQLAHIPKRPEHYASLAGAIVLAIGGFVGALWWSTSVIQAAYSSPPTETAEQKQQRETVDAMKKQQDEIAKKQDDLADAMKRLERARKK